MDGQTARRRDNRPRGGRRKDPYHCLLYTSKIDLADMEKKGIRMEDIEPHLKAMSYGHKSNGLVEMNPELENGMRAVSYTHLAS